MVQINPCIGWLMVNAGAIWFIRRLNPFWDEKKKEEEEEMF